MSKLDLEIEMESLPGQEEEEPVCNAKCCFAIVVVIVVVIVFWHQIDSVFE